MLVRQGADARSWRPNVAFELKEESLKAFQTRLVDAEPVAGPMVDLRGVDYRRPGAAGGYQRDASDRPDVYTVVEGDNPGR